MCSRRYATTSSRVVNRRFTFFLIGSAESLLANFRISSTDCKRSCASCGEILVSCCDLFACSDAPVSGRFWVAELSGVCAVCCPPAGWKVNKMETRRTRARARLASFAAAPARPSVSEALLSLLSSGNLVRNPLPRFLRAQSSTDVARRFSLPYRFEYGRFNLLRLTMQPEMIKHHGCGCDRSDGVGEVLTRHWRRRAVHWLKH